MDNIVELLKASSLDIKDPPVKPLAQATQNKPEGSNRSKESSKKKSDTTLITHTISAKGGKTLTALETALDPRGIRYSLAGGGAFTLTVPTAAPVRAERNLLASYTARQGGL
jgi:hypothetical protein